MSEIHGLESLSETALRARHASNIARIAEINAAREANDGSFTLAMALEHRELATDTNAVVEAVSAIVEPAVAVNDLPIVEVPAAPVANADGTIGTATATGTETFVAGQEAELAAALAAAASLASLSTAVSVRHEAPAGTEGGAAVQPIHQTLVASAAARIGSLEAGAPITLGDVAELVRTHAHNGKGGESLRLVTLNPAIAASAGVVSDGNSKTENTRIFADTVRAAMAPPSPEGLTAAPFTVCGPADILRDVPQCDNTERYVSNWFREVQSTHGQIQFYRGFGMADVVGAVNTWDQAAQAAVDPTDPDTWKDCLDIGCLPTATIGVEAVTQCASMPAFQSITSPEAVGSMIHAIRALTARVADGQLLRFFDTLSSAYTHNAGVVGTVGAQIDIYDLLGRMLGVFAASNRQIDLSNYTLGIEAGLLQHLSLDDLSACNAVEMINRARELWGSLGINDIEITPDWSDAVGTGPWSAGLPLNAPGAAAAAVPARPTTWRLRLFDKNDFAMLAPGGDTFGIVPDLNNKKMNRVTWFGEIYQGLGKLGCKPAATITVSNLFASGNRASCVAAV